jgi:two-component system, response regulator PdtaR
LGYYEEFPMKKNKVLIVEDDEIIQQVLEWRLHSLGYSVSGRAATAADALTSVKKRMPDAVLMNVHLKGDIDGIDAARMLKNMYEIPVIFVTSSSENKDLERAKKTHPDGYIVKPFNDTDLRVALTLAIPDPVKKTCR